MTKWVPGMIFMFHDPDGSYTDDEGYHEVEGDKSGTIATVEFPDDGTNSGNITLVFTHDAAQAERWRSLFAAGGDPDLKGDPPIERPRLATRSPLKVKRVVPWAEYRRFLDGSGPL